jgi:hypothetical protein
MVCDNPRQGMVLAYGSAETGALPIVEHDTDRMARGEPCTHVYDFYNKKLVAAFHCTHLTRPRTAQATVVINERPQLPGVMTEFQFAGETDSHGVPVR